ncbi:unnamed protein product [Durusdinium trenchii]|uniref:Exodeoxyribonuclease X-like C-terminal domain-containing protein n=2 Tax=Durusdinium trenchii TaxID=1381693 RepID=A0ABP0KRH9_9DINO
MRTHTHTRIWFKGLSAPGVSKSGTRIDNTMMRRSRAAHCGLLLVAGWQFLAFSMTKTKPQSLEPEVTFGKHKGEMASDVLDKDPDYCIWIVDTYHSGEATPALGKIAEWLIEHNPELTDQGSRRMGFGKHREESREWVMNNFPAYADWVIKKVQESEQQGESVYLPMKTFATYAQEWSEDEERD